MHIATRRPQPQYMPGRARIFKKPQRSQSCNPCSTCAGPSLAGRARAPLAARRACAPLVPGRGAGGLCRALRAPGIGAASVRSSGGRASGAVCRRAPRLPRLRLRRAPLCAGFRVGHVGMEPLLQCARTSGDRRRRSSDARMRVHPAALVCSTRTRMATQTTHRSSDPIPPTVRAGHHSRGHLGRGVLRRAAGAAAVVCGSGRRGRRPGAANRQGAACRNRVCWELLQGFVGRCRGGLRHRAGALLLEVRVRVRQPLALALLGHLRGSGFP